MRYMIPVMAVLIILAVTPAPARAAESTLQSTKIAIVDVGDVVERSKLKAEYDREFQAFVEEKRAEHEARRKELQKQLEAMQTELMVLAEEAQQEARRKMLEEQQRFQEYGMQLQREINQKENEYRKLLTDKVRDVVQQVAEEQQVNLVFSSIAVIFKDQVLDLTEPVLQKLDELYDKEHGASSGEEATDAAAPGDEATETTTE